MRGDSVAIRKWLGDERRYSGTIYGRGVFRENLAQLKPSWNATGDFGHGQVTIYGTWMYIGADWEPPMILFNVTGGTNVWGAGTSHFFYVDGDWIVKENA